MSYTPTSWNTGDTITAAAMNKIENGIANAGGALICNVEPINGYLGLNKTVQEIYDAMISGMPVYALYQYGTLSDYSGTLILAPVVRVINYNYTNVMRVYVNRPNLGTVNSHSESGVPGVMVYSADGLNDYPLYDANRTTEVNPDYVRNSSIS